MSLRRWLRLFQTRSDRYAAALSAAVQQRLGWTAEPGDDVSAVFTGYAPDGSPFTIRASLFDDGDDTHDRIEWRAGAPRLNELVLAISNHGARGRDWLRDVQIPVGLGHDSRDAAEVRAALNAAAVAGMPLKELNAYGLHLGCGGADGVVIRFQRSAIEFASIQIAGRRLLALAADAEAAAHMLAAPVPELLAKVASGVGDRWAATLEAFAGVPFSKVLVETRSASVELLQAIAELGAALRTRALTYTSVRSLT